MQITYIFKMKRNETKRNEMKCSERGRSSSSKYTTNCEIIKVGVQRATCTQQSTHARARSLNEFLERRVTTSYRWQSLVPPTHSMYPLPLPFLIFAIFFLLRLFSESLFTSLVITLLLLSCFYKQRGDSLLSPFPCFELRSYRSFYCFRVYASNVHSSIDLVDARS